jgi:uncharacterized membrane protein
VRVDQIRAYGISYVGLWLGVLAMLVVEMVAEMVVVMMMNCGGGGGTGRAGGTASDHCSLGST